MITSPNSLRTTLHNELNPGPQDTTGGLLFRLREQYVALHAQSLLASTSAEQRDDELNKFRDEFDKSIIDKIIAGSNDASADPAQFLSEKEKKAMDATKGIFSQVKDIFLSGFGMLGNVLGKVLEFMGFDNMAAKFITDTTDNRSNDIKALEKRAAGMAEALGDNIVVRGTQISLPAEMQAEFFHNFKSLSTTASNTSNPDYRPKTATAQSQATRTPMSPTIPPLENVQENDPPASTPATVQPLQSQTL